MSGQRQPRRRGRWGAQASWERWRGGTERGSASQPPLAYSIGCSSLSARSIGSCSLRPLTRLVDPISAHTYYRLRLSPPSRSIGLPFPLPLVLLAATLRPLILLAYPPPLTLVLLAYQRPALSSYWLLISPPSSPIGSSSFRSFPSPSRPLGNRAARDVRGRRVKSPDGDWGSALSLRPRTCFRRLRRGARGSRACGTGAVGDPGPRPRVSPAGLPSSCPCRRRRPPAAVAGPAACVLGESPGRRPARERLLRACKAPASALWAS